MREREKARIADHLQLQGSSDFGNKNFSIEIAQPKRKRRKRKKIKRSWCKGDREFLHQTSKKGKSAEGTKREKSKKEKKSKEKKEMA